MFNIGFTELLVVLVIAYVIVGPKDLPKVARWLGRMVRYARQLIRDLKAEVGWDEVINETQDVRRDIEGVMKDADIRKDLTEAQKTLQQSLREAEKDTMKKPGGANGAGKPSVEEPQTQAGPDGPPRKGTDIPVSFKEWESRKRQERAETLTEKQGAGHAGETGSAGKPEGAGGPAHPEEWAHAEVPAHTEMPEYNEKTEEKEK